MAFFAHIGTGFALKPAAPKAPVILLITAAMSADLVCFLLMALGVAGESILAWTHGLFISGVWALVFGFTSGVILKNARAGVFTGIAVFGHWLIDFITHPMYGGDMKPDIPLFLEGSPKVGLGLYGNLAAAIIIDLAVLAAGIALYVHYRLSQAKPPATSPGE
ncbi:MAG: hypothetical protein A2Y33_06720 [Spirochaetes bacterium GWF1_51_8]|nr:MAG: hypothetical protein A2Y33_06720 [Spirochaetes bacterium GWF1_51_8]